MKAIRLALCALLCAAIGFCAALVIINPCDVNRDGKVTATDLLVVKREILGLNK